MKKLIGLVALLTYAFATPLFAQTSPTTFHSQNGDTVIVKDKNGYFYQLTSADKAGVAPGGAYSGNVVIPSAISYNGSTYQVTTVRRGAMWKKADSKNIGTITKVSLPKSVTLVGADAFRGNASLKDVTYHSGTRIEVRSFWGCPSLILNKKPVKFAYTEPFFGEKPDLSKFMNFYYPSEEQDNSVTDYQWVVFKYQHSGISFNKWMNLKKENAMACWCFKLNNVKAGVFSLKDANNVSSLFKGNLNNSQNILLAHNNYVATHEFVSFSRHNFDENPKSMPQSFIQAMAKKYGRKVKYSNEAAKVLYTKKPEQIVITEFEITKHEAMIAISLVKDGKEVCSYVDKRKLESDNEEFSVWNVDDDGTYGIPTIISITKDENGNFELFFNHPAPESSNLHHLVQKGNKFVVESKEAWYNWVDAPDEE